jgi:WD40 repeat protein
LLFLCSAQESDLHDHLLSHDSKVNCVLYNDLFDCVVSAGNNSLVIVWATRSGEKIIQFHAYKV